MTGFIIGVIVGGLFGFMMLAVIVGGSGRRK